DLAPDFAAAARPRSANVVGPMSDVDVVVVVVGFDLAGHDRGGNIALAYAVEYRSEIRQQAVLEAPAAEDYTNLLRQQPGTFWWDWFINGSGPSVAERLVNAQPDVFYLPFCANSNGAISAAAQRQYLDAYRRPDSTHAGFELFRQQDAGEQQVGALVTTDGKLTIPTPGVGGQHSMGALVGKDMGDVAERDQRGGAGRQSPGDRGEARRRAPAADHVFHRLSPSGVTALNPGGSGMAAGGPPWSLTALGKRSPTVRAGRVSGPTRCQPPTVPL
ncbi:hypothetical protein ACFQ1S_17920, partial [Kibdelosporangium lantanae]